jgi:FtsP/CotA-like multicopper oxidase with cupredoxin domain
MARLLVAACALAALLLPAAAHADDAAPWSPIAGLPLQEPQQLYAHRGVLKVTLDAELRTISVSGSDVVAQPFNGRLIGPTLHVRPGDTIDVTFRNATPQDTNIHFHGMHVSPKGDGDNVFRRFRAGTTVHTRVTLPLDHSPGTYWYHAHFHGLTEPQVMGGMSGLIVVEGLERLLPRSLRGVRQRQIALRDLQTASSAPWATALSGEDIDVQKPTMRLVDGRLQPRVALRSGETQLWRLANIGSDLFYDVQLVGHQFTVIAEDGSPKWRVRTVNHLVMPPGKRFDVLVVGGKSGDYVFKTRKYHRQEGFELLPEVKLMDVAVLPRGHGTPAARRLPSGLNPAVEASPAGPIVGRPVVRHRTFTFSFALKSSEFARINGEAFDPSKTNVAPYVNTVEEWTLRNVTTEDHPFHIHVNDFQVMSVNGKPFHASGLQDVVIIPHRRNGKPGEVVIRIPFDQFTGHFVFHCHILAHEDGGMMMTVQVRKRGAPVTPPPGAARAHRHMLRSQNALLCRLRKLGANLRTV